MEYFSDQAFPDPGSAEELGLMLLIAILLIVSAIGLYRLRNWSRWLSLALASAAVLAGGLGVPFYKQQPGIDFTPGLIKLSLLISVPLGAWWWLLLTRRRVRAQFH